MNGMAHYSTEEMLLELQRRLLLAEVASCRCMTKTPDPAHHNTDCPYRRLATAGDHLDQAEELLKGVLIQD